MFAAGSLADGASFALLFFSPLFDEDEDEDDDEDEDEPEDDEEDDDESPFLPPSRCRTITESPIFSSSSLAL